jgi:hypothetical protein
MYNRRMKHTAENINKNVNDFNKFVSSPEPEQARFSVQQ